MQRVSEVMTRNVQSVTPQETVRRAAQMMDELNVGALPVCDGERLVGMVTDRDITVRATSAGLGPNDAVVDEVMSTDVRWCFEDQPLEELMQQMADTQIRRVPVVSHDEAHRLVGIVSLGDIATRTTDRGQDQDIEQVVEKISFPSEPDRSSSGNAQDAPNATGSDTGTASGFAGSKVLDDQMHPDLETASNADPSDMVEVTPDQLLNRNAPGSTAALPSQSVAGMKSDQEEPVVVRRTGSAGSDLSTGGPRVSDGIDAAGPSGPSGGVAGATGSSGTGVGAKP